MGRTFVRQETQVMSSESYVDNVVPSLANYETNPAHVEDDLNNLRSQAHNLLKLQSGNWYDDIAVPSTFEGGAKRGVDGLNQDLHDLERKRVLVDVYSLDDITVPACAFASGVLTASANFGNGETVTLDAKTYTFQTTLTNVDGNVQLGGSLTASLQNLHDAINLTGTPGTQYAALMTIHPTVECTASDATTLTAQAKLGGTQGNLIATTEGAANASWAASTLLGGTGDVVVLALSELPSNTTAAIGVVTTLGTVAAYNANFGNASLAVVAGTNVLNPKNLGFIEDTITHDPIISGGRVVYALFQTESNTDGSTMTGTTPNRAQLTFVRINTGGTALELVPSADICTETIHFSTRERKALDALTEEDFLKGAVIDVGGATTVARQTAYDNQGVTPVDVTTHSYLDLESPGLVWQIRDDLEAVLFGVTEGSAGGTSVVQVGADVDTFDVNAAVNDFLQGITVDSGGTSINVGVTAGQIDSAGALTVASGGAGNLTLNGASGDVIFSDQNYAGSTYDTPFNLSDSSSEWDLFEINFGEVSLLNALNQAYSHGARGTKVYASVTANVAADTDVGGSSGGANLDAQLPDMSGGSFLTDYDVFVNGELMRPGADASANNDYYPGTSLTLGQLKFEFKLRLNPTPDVICVVPYS